MKMQHLNSIMYLSAAAGLLTGATPAQAVPVTGRYQDVAAACDLVPNQILTHELGDATTFPLNEAVVVNVAPVNFTVCVPNDGLANDWVVQIRNVSGQAWRDLFFVVDNGASVGNYDGELDDLALAPNVFSQAFKIDGTVTVTGMNDNLLFESGPVDEIFQPGEVWRFAVSNFNNYAASNAPPIFTSPGRFSGSSPLGTFGSTASILATPVPEPSAGLALLVTSSFLLMRRRR